MLEIYNEANTNRSLAQTQGRWWRQIKNLGFLIRKFAQRVLYLSRALKATARCRSSSPNVQDS